MATVSKIIERAFRKLGVKAEDEALTADQQAAGLDALNEMLAAWQLQGVNVSIYDMQATDQFPLAARFEEGVIYLLASRLSSEYVAPIGFDPDAFMRQVQANLITMPTSTLDSALVETVSQRELRGYPR